MTTVGKRIELAASDGFALSAYRADPAGTPRGGLVVAQEIFGVNSHIRSVCDGFAADGYVAIAPALFDRYERGVDIGYTPPDIARGRELKAKAGIDAALLDVAAARDALAGIGKIGVVGYCWGGYVAWMAAARLAGFACAVPYYGGGMLEAVGEQPKCPVMAHFGERDTMIPAAGVREFAAAQPTTQVFFYAADHGFNCDQRATYDAAAATLARQRTIEFLRKHLG
jgi:carboxymethylenebutenolidase